MQRKRVLALKNKWCKGVTLNIQVFTRHQQPDKKGLPTQDQHIPALIKFNQDKNFVVPVLGQPVSKNDGLMFSYCGKTTRCLKPSFGHRIKLFQNT